MAPARTSPPANLHHTAGHRHQRTRNPRNNPSQAENGDTVVAAQNCTKEAAARADSLTAALTRSGIPVNRTHHVSFSFTNADEGGRERISELMKGELPIVFLNGRGKANPQPDEVVAEFQSGK